MMSVLSFFKKSTVYILLFFYGLFYHISSSEFWPVTVSKTWFDWNHFEYSLLQKPLFGLFLAFFHLLPSNDVLHIYLVKSVFTFIGVVGLVFYIKVLCEISEIKLPDRHSHLIKSLFVLLVLVMSPTLLHNFFRIRADQVSFLFFTLSLLFNYRKQFLKSLLFLTLIPLISIKGFIFLIPAFFVVMPNYKLFFKQLKTLHKYYIILSFLAVFIWIIGLNISAITYLFDTYKTMGFPNRFLRNYLLSESILIIFSLLTSLYLLYKNNEKLKPYALASIASLILILLLPQSYPFYIASLAPILYLPLFVLLLNTQRLTTVKKISAISIQTITVFSISLYLKSGFYYSMNSQMAYIRKVSELIEKHNLSYLDGMGILPRQKFVSCFVSPGDNEANNTCTDYIKNNAADVVIVTQRLAFFGTDLFTEIQKNYTQVLPNLWIKNTYKSLYSEDQIDLLSLVPAIFIFGFD